MEAARALPSPLAERHARRFAAECEALRPLGIAYVLRNFGNRLGRADAEDAVAEVILRLHRQAARGAAPENLRAAFFTGARNAAIDQLRSRAAKPTVGLEAAAEAPLAEPSPAERAEAGEDATRLREALARMRPNYREAIVLRFGLDLTVPEIAARLAISLPAAKKLVLRATEQARKRLAAIEGAEFCPQMREALRESLLDREAAGLAEPAESAALRAHLAHCGSCRSFLASLHSNLHELGSTALLGGYATQRSGALPQLGGLIDRIGHGAQAASAKARLALHKLAAAAVPDGGAPAPALAGAGQKLAAICTAGAAGAATCLATGIVGPGLAPAPSRQQPPIAPVAHAKRPRPPAPPRQAAAPAAPATTPTTRTPAKRPGAAAASQAKALAAAARAPAAAQPEAEAAPAAQAAAEFGFEAESPAPSAAPSTAAASDSAPASARASPAPTSSSGGGGSSGAEQFGFGG